MSTFLFDDLCNNMGHGPYSYSNSYIQPGKTRVTLQYIGNSCLNLEKKEYTLQRSFVNGEVVTQNYVMDNHLADQFVADSRDKLRRGRTRGVVFEIMTA